MYRTSQVNMRQGRNAIASILTALACTLPSTSFAQYCQASVKTGFSGDLNAIYDSGGSDSGPGGSGGGDAGAGAGEGKVLGGLMEVQRLSDGVSLGIALTDSDQGLVHVKLCQGDLPVLMTLTGGGGVKYFDESIGRLADFGPGRTLHALIDTLDENIGLSPLTEGAYRYALAHLAPDGNVYRLTLNHVSTANDLVLKEINRLQTGNMKLVSIKSLPTPIDETSGSNALPNNRYGVAAAVLGGFVSMAGQYVGGSSTPALDVGEQLATDLADGRIDGFGVDRQPASKSSDGSVAYDLVRLPIATNVGANAVSARFGASSTLPRAAPISERTFAGSSVVNRCSGESESATLVRDGTITRTHTACSGFSETKERFATDVRLVEGSGVQGSGGTAARTFYVKSDGSVWGWGDTFCGLLGNGESDLNYREEPVLIPGLAHVTAIASGTWFTIARDDSGAVYSWGLNYLGELGRGPTPVGSVPCQNDYTSSEFSLDRAALTPARVDGLTDIVSITTDGYSPAAIDKKGSLFQWGLIPTGFDTIQNKPQYYAQRTPAKVEGLPMSIAVASSYTMKVALTADGTLWGWGPNVIGNFGDGTLTPHLVPAQVPGIANVVEIAAGGDSPFVALLQDGTIRYWGGCCLGKNGSIPAYLQKIPTAPPAATTRFYAPSVGAFAGTLPAIRHVKASSGKVLLYGADGSLFQFPRSAQDPTFEVVDSPPANYQGLWWNPSESGWGINLAHQGDVIFATWFTYDAAGKALWLSATATTTGPKSYAGTLYQTRGPAFNAVPFAPSAVMATPVGSLALSFHDAHNGVFSYSLNGVSQSKAITRQVFAQLPACSFGTSAELRDTTNYQDLWWAAPAGVESGWGINLTHQGDVIYATWFTYDLDGSPLWLSVVANKSAPKTYTGKLNRTSGPAFSSVPFDHARVTLAEVGTATLSFASGNLGAFSYTVNGVSQVKSIVRQVFRQPGTMCQ